MLQNWALTDHVVKRRVIAAGEEVWEEVDHHQAIFLSLKVKVRVKIITRHFISAWNHHVDDDGETMMVDEMESVPYKISSGPVSAHRQKKRHKKWQQLEK